MDKERLKDSVGPGRRFLFGLPRTDNAHYLWIQHVHLAIRLSRTLTIADLVENLKTSSSKWLKTQSADLAAFSWQRGYGCFSVGPADLDSLCAYIDKQEEHHRARTFQEEFRMFLKKYGVAYDEAYLWD